MSSGERRDDVRFLQEYLSKGREYLSNNFYNLFKGRNRTRLHSRDERFLRGVRLERSHATIEISLRPLDAHVRPSVGRSRSRLAPVPKTRSPVRSKPTSRRAVFSSSLPANVTAGSDVTSTIGGTHDRRRSTPLSATTVSLIARCAFIATAPRV